MKTLGLITIIGFFVLIALVIYVSYLLTRYEFSNIKIGQMLFISSGVDECKEYYTKVEKIINEGDKHKRKVVCDDGNTYGLYEYFWGIISKS